MPQANNTFLLIRHGHTDAIGRRLVGRLPEVHLSGTGRAQAQRLRERLRDVPLAQIYASPMERAIETAQPLAEARGLEIQRLDGLTEVEFGSWTGLTFDQLAQYPEWHRFNTNRAAANVPGGERAADVQSRIVDALETLHARHTGETIAVVSHADVIRAAVLHYIGSSLDMVHRIDITPASITGLLLGPGGPRLLYINNRDLTE